MDIYLAIAEQILRSAKRPLGPREILREAYSSGLVPPRLFGRTQHKTLQARLSEDILVRRDRSVFFRTAPGRFFLTEYLTDLSIPEQYREPILARRRSRDLPSRNVLALSERDLGVQRTFPCIPSEQILDALSENHYHYVADAKLAASDERLVWSFVVVTRNSSVLTYRHGRYREERDGFLKRRSIGFFTPVVDSDRGLFDQEDHGIVSSGLKALGIDLGVLSEPFWEEITSTARLECFVLPEGDAPDLLALVRFECPEWFEPLTRRLAINDVRWQDLQSPVNHIEDFDPWSQAVMGQVRRFVANMQDTCETGSERFNKPDRGRIHSPASQRERSRQQ